MRKKLITFFILLVIIPVIVIYSVAVVLFSETTMDHLKILYQNHALSLGRLSESYFSDARNLSMYPLLEPNLNAFFLQSSNSLTPDDYVKANNALASIPFVFSNSIRNVSAIRIDGKYISKGIEMTTAYLLSDEEKVQADELDGQVLWIYSSRKPDALVLVRLIKNTTDLSQKLGYIKVTLSLTALLQQLGTEMAELNAQCYLQDEKGNIVVPSPADTTSISPEILTLMANRDATKTQITADSQYLVSSYAINNGPFWLYIVAKPQVFSTVFLSLIKSFSVVTACALTFSIILAVAFSKIITNPLEKLGKYMRSISREDFSVRAEVKGKDEITQLSNNFNNMVTALDILYNDVYLSEIKLREAQLLALQSQIDPHFLYNTLDTIYWMNQMGDNQNAGKMVSSLSQMMRLTLSPDNQNTISLLDELAHLECYITIQKIRYQDNLSFSIHCDEELKPAKVLKNILQPLVENAIKHGFSKQKKGEINLFIQREGDILKYEIKNNGAPIDIKKVQKLLNQSSKTMQGFAIKNIQDRIKLKYGDAYSIDCYLEDDFNVFVVTQRWDVYD